MAVLNKLMARGVVPPEVHGLLDYPLAAIIIAGAIVFDLHSAAARVIALAFGAGAAMLAVPRQPISVGARRRGTSAVTTRRVEAVAGAPDEDRISRTSCARDRRPAAQGSC